LSPRCCRAPVRDDETLRAEALECCTAGAEALKSYAQRPLNAATAQRHRPLRRILLETTETYEALRDGGAQDMLL
jgi:hypothetical protein